MHVICTKSSSLCSPPANLAKNIVVIAIVFQTPLIPVQAAIAVGSRKRVWIIFDEIASLNYLPSLEKGLTISRNFGGCFVIALQSISQLIRRYVIQDAETISSNCSSKIILKAGNNQTRMGITVAWYSRG